jgi:hypothetical protein
MPMETLESMVVEGFSSVPHNHLPPDDFQKFASLAFSTSEFKKMYWVKPVKDICVVSVSCMKGWYVIMRYLSCHVGRFKKELWLLISLIFAPVSHNSM